MNLYENFSETFEVEKLKSLILETEIVSFDIFDTLLLRNVIKATDIFKVIEREYFKQKNIHINFFEERIKAEQQARLESSYEDITLDDIYYQIEKKFSHEDAKILKLLELQIEKKFIVPNNRLKEIYDYAILLNKKVLLISDMYLPKEVISQLLDDVGFSGWTELFVSSEIGVSKATGNLYSYVRNQLNIDDKKLWIHIGDNYVSDVKQAKKNNILAFHFEQPMESNFDNTKASQNLTFSIMRAVQLNQFYLDKEKNESYWYNFGCTIASTLYIGLMNWLVRKLENENNIYFLARDGYVPFKVYQMYKEHIPNLPESKYLYASRRAFVYPYLLDMPQTEALSYLVRRNSGFNQKLTIKEILENLDLSPINYINTINYMDGISLEDEITDTNEAIVKQFLNKIWGDIVIQLKSEREHLLQYLNIEGVISEKKINIFDIGWAGSTQLALKKMTGQHIQGFYLGTSEDVDFQIRNEVEGYLFNLGSPFNARNSVIRSVMIYEFIFSGLEGTLINFSRNSNNEIVPNLLDVTNNYIYLKAMEEMHRGAFKTIKHFLNYYEYAQEEINSEVLSLLIDFERSKKTKDLLAFSQLTSTVAIGKSKEALNYSVIYSISEYMRNKKAIELNASKLLWPNAILIRDNQNRLFNESELNKLYDLKINNRYKKINRVIYLLKRAIKDPKLAFKKLIRIINVIIRRS